MTQNHSTELLKNGLLCFYFRQTYLIILRNQVFTIIEYARVHEVREIIN